MKVVEGGVKGFEHGLKAIYEHGLNMVCAQLNSIKHNGKTPCAFAIMLVLYPMKDSKRAGADRL